MALKRIIIAIDEKVSGLTSVRFALNYFGGDKNRISILWLGKLPNQNERSNAPEMQNASVKIASIPMEQRTAIYKIIMEEYPDSKALITSETLDNFTRKQLTTLCSFSDILLATFEVFEDHLSSMFANFVGGRKYNKVCCPKILISKEFEYPESIVLVKTDQVNTIATVKQFCHIFNEHCADVNLNLLDLQDDNRTSSVIETQRLLVDYLKQHSAQPAIYTYSGEDAEKLAYILNLTKNTIWVSPLESIEELELHNIDGVQEEFEPS
jgi:hypothetical protein